MESVAKISISDQQSNAQIAKSLFSNVVSSLSSGMFGYGLAFMLLHETNSPLSFGLDIIIGPIVSFLFFIPIGNYVDHHGHKRILTVTYLLRLILLAIFAIALPKFSGMGLLVPVIIFLFLDSIMSNLRSTTFSASVHELVNKQKISALSSFTQACSAGAQILSPLLGVLLYNLVSFEVFIGFEFVATMVAFLTMLTMHFFVEDAVKKAPSQRHQFKDFKMAFAYMKKRRLILDIIVMAVVINFLASIFMIGLPYIVVSELHFPNQVVSYLNMAFSIGIIGGSIGANVLQKKIKFTQRIFIPLFIMAVMTILLGLALSGALSQGQTVLWGIVILIGQSISIAILNVSMDVRIQTTVPTKVLGRVNSTLVTGCTISMPLGTLIYSGLLKVFAHGYYLLLISGGLMLIYILIITYFFLKDFHRDDEYLQSEQAK